MSSALYQALEPQTSDEDNEDIERPLHQKHLRSTSCSTSSNAPHPMSDLDGQLSKASGKLVVLDFFATWCGPCKMISPKLAELSTQYADNIVVLKVDVDDCEDIAMEYNISSMPTFVFIKNGVKVEEFAGANASRLEDVIKANI